MKKLVLLVALVVTVAGQAWGVDCKQLATKYIVASQNGDYTSLLSMSEMYQLNSKAIKKNAPKYAQDSKIKELADSEKGRLVTLMFTSDVKWKIVDMKRTRFDKKNEACFVYIQTEYDNQNRLFVISSGLMAFPAEAELPCYQVCHRDHVFGVAVAPCPCLG